MPVRIAKDPVHSALCDDAGVGKQFSVCASGVYAFEIIWSEYLICTVCQFQFESHLSNTNLDFKSLTPKKCWLITLKFDFKSDFLLSKHEGIKLNARAQTWEKHIFQLHPNLVFSEHKRDGTNAVRHGIQRTNRLNPLGLSRFDVPNPETSCDSACHMATMQLTLWLRRCCHWPLSFPHNNESNCMMIYMRCTSALNATLRTQQSWPLTKRVFIKIIVIN